MIVSLCFQDSVFVCMSSVIVSVYECVRCQKQFLFMSAQDMCLLVKDVPFLSSRVPIVEQLKIGVGVTLNHALLPGPSLLCMDGESIAFRCTLALCTLVDIPGIR